MQVVRVENVAQIMVMSTFGTRSSMRQCCCKYVANAWQACRLQVVHKMLIDNQHSSSRLGDFGKNGCTTFRLQRRTVDFATSDGTDAYLTQQDIVPTVTTKQSNITEFETCTLVCVKQLLTVKQIVICYQLLPDHHRVPTLTTKQSNVMYKHYT